MGIQARMSEGDPRLYNVSRDVAHCFGDVCRETSRRLEDGKWPFLMNYLVVNRVTDDELGEACRAFLEFVGTSTDIREERQPAQALTRVGWFAVREEAQVAFLAVMATVMLGLFYTGVREATMGGEGPCLTYGDLAAAGQRVSRLMALPRWRRTLEVWKYRGRLWLLKKLGAEPVVTPLLAHLDYDAKLTAVANRARRDAAMRQAANTPRPINAERTSS